ncbi:hypothetical protein TrRE_jg203 [Triparma retinervis]|uniref:Isochorismatase-like domain-containing protein n=1 Tax=Triparma retinervis TaxID=2557542 RepID=A0A9W7FWT4_9STRA|nr:hypothetical protein TrRE_jg203 [Triparma retinervis]
MSTKSALLLIDPQVDFHPSGSLGIPSASKDANRLRSLLELHPSPFQKLFITLDSHHLLDIAHPGYWVDKNGSNPPPFTLITHADVSSGAWSPSDPSDRTWSLSYTSSLESAGRFTLCIWPVHCLVGSPGHAVDALVLSGVNAWLSGGAGREVRWVLKGQNRRTEMYSCMRAEVTVEGDPSTGFNEKLMEEIDDVDTLYVGGQARSHCVNFSVRDILPRFKGKLKVLGDGCSDVPGFEEAGREFVEWVKENGGEVVQCKDVK